MRFTIGYIEHDKDMFDRFLGKSIERLKEDFDIISIPSTGSFPSSIYNSMIRKSNTRYVILSHEDIAFTPDMLDRVDVTIKHIGGTFGVLGVVGKSVHDGKVIWSNYDRPNEITLVDSCFIVIDKENDIWFDEVMFDELHMYGEDYAMQCLRKGLKNYTIMTRHENRKISDVVHYSNTCKKEGFMWGRWREYRNKFNKKWKINANKKKR